MGTMTMPKGSRRMWGMGSSVTWPPRWAVGSPSFKATRAWRASCRVVEKRKARYQAAPLKRVISGDMVWSRRAGAGCQKKQASGGHHAGFAGVVEEAAGIHHGADIAEGFEGVGFSGLGDGDGGAVQIHGDDIAGLQGVAKAVGAFAGIEFACGDGVAKEDAGETFGEDEVAAGGAEGDGSVLAGAAAAEIAAGDDDGIGAWELVLLDEADGVKGVGQPGEGVAAEFFVFGGDGGDEVEVLGGDDLVGVNVVAHDVNGACKNRLHGGSVPEGGGNSRVLLEALIVGGHPGTATF